MDSFKKPSTSSSLKRKSALDEIIEVSKKSQISKMLLIGSFLKVAIYIFGLLSISCIFTWQLIFVVLYRSHLYSYGFTILVYHQQHSKHLKTSFKQALLQKFYLPVSLSSIAMHIVEQLNNKR